MSWLDYAIHQWFFDVTCCYHVVTVLSILTISANFLSENGGCPSCPCLFPLAVSGRSDRFLGPISTISRRLVGKSSLLLLGVPCLVS